MRSKAVFLLVFLWSPSTVLGLEASGYLRIDKRYPLNTKGPYFLDFYNEFFYRIEGGGPTTSFVTSLMTRFYSFPRITTLGDLQNPDRVAPMDLFLWEAYVDIRRFPIQNIDLRVGKQRLNWGTADGFNPTDYFNPEDLSDFLRLTRKLPVESFEATYYLNGFSLTAVWSPTANPILFPRDLPLVDLSSFVEGMEVSRIEENLELPSREWKNSQVALKAKVNLWGYDVSFSAFSGHEHFPLPTRIVLSPDPQEPPTMISEMTFELPRVWALGADFAGDLGDFGVWGEGGVFFPTPMDLRIITPAGEQTTPVLSDQPYLKWILGVDTFFWDGAYINLQFSHGFPTEIGKDQMGSYLLATFEKPFLSDRFIFRVRNIFETRDFYRPTRSWGTLVAPEISYFPDDNLEILLGMAFLSGKEGTLFGRWQDWDVAYLSIEASF